MIRISGPYFLAAAALAFLLAGLFGGGVNAFDLAIVDRAAAIRVAAPPFTEFVRNFTELGGGRFTLGLTAIAAVSLLLRRLPGSAILLAVTVIAERNLVDLLKDLTNRPRPPLDLLPVMPQSLAYPSGHAANSMTAFLAVALLAFPPSYRWAASVAALILSLGVGLSRIWLGVHWPSDVIGGWAFGLFAVGLAIAVGQWSGALRLEPKHDVIGGHAAAASEDEPA